MTDVKREALACSNALPVVRDVSSINREVSSMAPVNFRPASWYLEEHLNGKIDINRYSKFYMLLITPSD